MNKLYSFKVTCKNPCRAPSCKYPREFVTERIRTPSRIWVDHELNLIREVVYPRELWFTDVLPDDPVENFIISLSNDFPDWDKIIIEKN